MTGVTGGLASATSPDVMSVLELLAEGAPAARFEELLRAARHDGASDGTLAELDQAVRLASRVQALIGHAQQREAGLAALVDTAHDLTLVHGMEALLHEIARRARRLLNFDMAYIGLRDGGDGRPCSIRAAEGETTSRSVGLKTSDDSGLGSLVQRSGAPAWSPDYLADREIPHSPDIDAVVRAEGLHAILAVPLGYGTTVFGTLYGADRKIRHFTPDEISLMRSLGKLAGVAIERARLLEETRAEVTELERDTSRARSSLDVQRRVEAAYIRLIDLVLSGCDPQTLVEAAVEELSGSLVVRDCVGRVVVVTGTPPELAEDDVLRWTYDAHATGCPVPMSEGGSEGGWVAPVAAGGENLGAIMLVPDEPLTDGFGVRLLQLTARAVALILLLQRTSTVAHDQIRDELLEELLSDIRPQPHQLIPRARRLGIAIDEPHVMVVARPEGGPEHRTAAWASSYAHRMSGLMRFRDGCVTLLIRGEDPLAAATAVSGELAPLVGHPVTVGAAGPVSGPARVAQAHREALSCLEALTELGNLGGVATPQQMGFLGVLLSETHGIGDYIESVIGPVLDYDTQRFTELTRTLDAYFAAGSSPTRAAASLHVHPNTVSRRLERITELLGADWQDPERALEIQLALRLHRTRRTLQHRHAASGGVGDTGRQASQGAGE
ncbi:helix-turn-helix domain-containing protein [Streptomyces coeruleorubidus]|uniref:helix-turn-helix domain-containing protein n=1 Tax=Streptomyces coeruleorubidus TaxID=116188 RepID=UPI00237F4F3B|nr:helix-turn-helix domain-containing protein [Streptomyces coeruleorubidus]WDV52380.1 helix-turn-helix domain-containing protein [Streptomyces coeruleorubidus]